MMNDLMIKIIEQLNGAVFVLVTLLILSFWAVWKVSQAVTLFSGFKEERAETKADIKTIKTDLSKIDGTVGLLYQSYLSTIKSHSPLSLTDIGQKISNDLHIEEKVGIHWDEIRKIIDRHNPSNPYDVQAVAMDTAKECFEKIFTEQEQNEMKLYAYQDGKNLLEIFPIIGIVVRNRVLAERGNTTEEIDRHAPRPT